MLTPLKRGSAQRANKVPKPRSGAPVLDGLEAAFSICANNPVR